MGKNTPPRGRRATIPLAWLVVSVAGCSPGPGPDPRALSASFQVTFSSPMDNAPPVEVCELMPSGAPPAPAGEIGTRTLQTERRPTAVALGRTAAAWIDSSVEQALSAVTPEATNEFASCTDRDAVELTMVGRADYALIGGELSERDVRAGLREQRLGVELFALAVAADSPVRSLSRSQLRQVFTGQVTQWQQLGFDGGAIVCVVPSDRTLADRAAHTLIPGDEFGSNCVRVASEQHVADQLLRHKGAIGIVRVTKAPRDVGQKLLQIDWFPPTPEAFAFGTYPFGVPLNLVSAGPAPKTAQQFVDFARSENGSELLGRSMLLLP